MMYFHVASASLLLFTIALLLGKQKKLSDYILIVWLLLFLSNLVTFIAIAVHPFPFDFWLNLLVKFSDSSVFLHGPLFWYYASSLSKPDSRFNKKTIWHCLPFIVVFGFMCSGILYDSSHMNVSIKGLSILKFASLIIYTVTVFLRLKTHRNVVKDIFSNTTQKYLSWLLLLSVGIMALWTVAVATTLLDWISFYNSVRFNSRLLQVSVDVFIMVMSYFGFRQKSLYEMKDNLDIPNGEIRSLISIQPSESNVKYQRSGLNENRAKELHTQLIKLMETDRIFKDEDLTLFKLAKMLGVSPNHVSQVINTLEHRNFFDYINLLRIEEVKKRIVSKQHEHLTLLGIAFECGFNSKAAFNRAFKKFTGVTPTEFKRGSYS
jgi:AraC-like DNA-binding protein